MRHSLSLVLCILCIVNCSEDNPLKTPIVEPLISEGLYKGYFGYDDYTNPDSIFWNPGIIEITFTGSEYFFDIGYNAGCPTKIDGEYHCDDSILFMNDTTNYLLNGLCCWEIYSHDGHFKVSRINDSLFLEGLDSTSYFNYGCYFQLKKSV